MFKKVIINYDEDTGELTDANKDFVAFATIGMYEFHDLDSVGVSQVEALTPEIDVIKLLGMGVSPDDIIKLKSNGLLK